jgi:hypothetical protein
MTNSTPEIETPPVEPLTTEVIDTETGEVVEGPGAALVTTEAKPPGVAALTLRTIEEYQRFASMMFAAGLNAKDNKTTAVAKLCVSMQFGAELGFSVLDSITGVHVINGNPSLSAKLKKKLFNRQQKYRYRVKEHSDQVCSIAFFEVNGEKWEDLGTSTFTLEDAHRAGLNKNPVWGKYPKNMLFARAFSNGFDWFCDQIGVSNVAEEAEVVEAGARVVEQEQGVSDEG